MATSWLACWIYLLLYICNGDQLCTTTSPCNGFTYICTNNDLDCIFECRRADVCELTTFSGAAAQNVSLKCTRTDSCVDLYVIQQNTVIYIVKKHNHVMI